MIATERVINDLNVAKLMLCNSQVLTPEMCVKIGQAISSAIVLLKEQEARVMTLDELTEIYVEFKGDNCPIRLTNFDLQKIVKHMVDGVCRLWTSKPTDKQRKAVKWDEIVCATNDGWASNTR